MGVIVIIQGDECFRPKTGLTVLTEESSVSDAIIQVADEIAGKGDRRHLFGAYCEKWSSHRTYNGTFVNQPISCSGTT